MPALAYADGESKTVRVGWYESPFNMTDEDGNRSGYAYEYQRKVASYTGWEYEYVEGSWVALFHMLENGENFGVAVCIFDCNDLKVINDKYGHDKGDDYIKNACHYICTTFRRSAVFRIGGDEFSAVMMNDDFASRDELIARFHSEQEAISRDAEDPWNQLHIAIGVAVYDPESDRSLEDTIKRADDLMYENKRKWKEQNK